MFRRSVWFTRNSFIVPKGVNRQATDSPAHLKYSWHLRKEAVPAQSSSVIINQRNESVAEAQLFKAPQLD